MLSFVEHVLVTEKIISRDELRSRSRSGGPGDDDSEKARHRRDVFQARKGYHTKKRKGFKNPEEEKQERSRYKLKRRSLQKRLHRSLGGHSMQ